MLRFLLQFFRPKPKPMDWVTHVHLYNVQEGRILCARMLVELPAALEAAHALSHRNPNQA